MSPSVGPRIRALAPGAGSFAVAGAAALFLAVHLAPRYDEFHTLAYLHDGDLGALWRSYRAVGDTLPPAAYVGWWSWSRVAGTSILAARIPSVLAWAVAAAAVSGLTRRAGGWASFASGLLASATSLVFLGAFARPYAVALACLAVAMWCWQRAATAGRPNLWLVATGVAFAAASALHYATAAVAVVVAAVALLGRGPGRRRGPVVAPLVGGVLPVLLSAALIPQAIEDQGRLVRVAGVADAVGFWPSALRPAASALGVVAAVVVAAWCWPGADRAQVRRRLLDASLLRSGWALAVAVPVVTVAAMALTSGTYVHRYSIGALLGGAIVVAEAIGRAARRWWWTGAVAALALVAAVGLGTRSITEQMVSRQQAHALAAELASASDGVDVVVLDEYDHLLLRWSARPDLVERLHLGATPTVAHSPAPVDLAARFDDPHRTPFEVVGTPAQITSLPAGHEGWTARVLAEVTYRRPGSPQHLVLALVGPA